MHLCDTKVSGTKKYYKIHGLGDNMGFFQTRNITKQYGRQKVLNDICLSAEQGEFVSILGESGSGKTTLLRIISGLEEQFTGEIFIGDSNITRLSAQKRGISMVFQESLLFPHLSAIENIEFGMKIRGVPKSRRYGEAKKLLELVQMQEHENKYPNQLSGGQKQRIAIARAVIVKPLLLLLDEPFFSLDANLRVNMCEFIRSIQRQTGITTILVTHDREEAMKISDRMALFHGGSIAQFDKPAMLYENPSDLYTASFMGDINILAEEEDYYMVIRPENVYLCNEAVEEHNSAVVKDLQYTGSRTKCKALYKDREIILFLPGNAEKVRIGDKIYITIDRNKIQKIKA